MSIYEWNGPEEALGKMPVTAVRLVINSSDEKDGKTTATGIFVFHDHMEGCRSDEIPWEAEGDGKEWTVKSVEDTPFRSRETGESLFCLLESVNADIKQFISQKLLWIALYKKKNPKKQIDLVDEPERFSGTVYAYTGQCVCEELRRSTWKSPFPWLRYTNNGQYPKKCFQCSCGKKWHRGNPSHELWWTVSDEKAWKMLTEFNGVAVEPIAFHPDSNPPAIVLLSTLRSEGFIPLR
jgi:hypothetical protein